MQRASGNTASATLVHQNQLFLIIIVIILLDYVYIVHIMYLYLHICISIDFGNKYLSIYLNRQCTWFSRRDGIFSHELSVYCPEPHVAARAGFGDEWEKTHLSWKTM